MHIHKAVPYICITVTAAAVVTLVLLTAPADARAQLTDTQRAQLEERLAELEEQLEEQRGILRETQAERTSIERDIAVLEAEIETARLSIQHRNVTLQQLAGNIDETEASIEELDERLSRSHESLAQLIRRTRETDDMSLVEMLLSGDLSEVFENLDNYTAIKESLDRSFAEIRTLKEDLNQRTEVLEGRYSEEDELRRIQVLEAEAIEAREAEKQELLSVTQSEEEEYQRSIADQEQTAAQIRAALFDLRDSSAIPFGDAYQFAREASNRTGVRPALILAILKTESNLGENVGTGNWRDDMHPDRDQPVFEELMAELGRDPDEMPVSAKPWYGWGGAMGPAQFIPSTWVLYKDRIADAAGQSPPNPWDPRTAIFASSILMMDNGADSGSAEAERLAALRYFAGWTNADNPSYAFYGDEVMRHVADIQRQIDVLEGN